MGRLTDDMTRLVGEIHMSHADRARKIRDLKHATVEMLAGFRFAHADMARRQQPMLRDFVSGLRATVAGLRKEFAAELAGAHRAWFGTMTAAMPGRTRRGGKWFSGESA